MLANMAANTSSSALITSNQDGALKTSSSNNVSTMATSLQEMSKTTARAYQLEMYDESRKRNIIVAMDTGSGKTLIAVERIRDELLRERVTAPPGRLHGSWYRAYHWPINSLTY